MQAVAFLLFALSPLTTAIAIANVVLSGLVTSVRTTAQGLVYGSVRVVLFFWSLAVPVIAVAGVSSLGWLLAVFLVISGVIGVFFMPDTAGKTLEEIQREREAAR